MPHYEDREHPENIVLLQFNFKLVQTARVPVVSGYRADSRRIAVLTSLVASTKKAVDIVHDHVISRDFDTHVLDQAVQFLEIPQAIRKNQGSEFIERALHQWAYRNDGQIKLIQPSKPTQNTCIKSSITSCGINI